MTANAMLDRDEERDLIRRWQDAADRRALDRLIRAYQPLVRAQARRFARYGVAGEDLEQEGCIALMEAVARFDTGRDVRFGTYAIWWLRAAMQDYVLRNRSLVRLGSAREARALFFTLRHVQARTSGAGRDGASARAAALLGVAPEAVERMDAVLRRGDVSLDLALPDSEDALLTLLPDDAPGPEAHVIAGEAARQRAATLRQALDSLSPRERAVVRARRLDDEPPTLRSIGSGLGVSTERVRQIERAAVGKMRAALFDAAVDPDALFDDGGTAPPPARAGRLSPAPGP